MFYCLGKDSEKKFRGGGGGLGLVSPTVKNRIKQQRQQQKTEKSKDFKLSAP